MTYTSGHSLFEAACLPNPKSRFGLLPGSYSRRRPYQLPIANASSFPEPLVRHNDDHLRGYYLTQPDLSDVAVLQIPTFRLTEGQTPFSHAARAFFEKALSDGKSRLVIDLSGNPGGDVNEGFDLFRAFFPDQKIYSATRFRATELIYLLGKIFSSASGQEKLTKLDLDPHIIASKAVNPKQTEGFASWDSLYGPEVINGARMSRLYSVFNATSASTEENPISGYGEAILDPSRRLFLPEDIVMVSSLVSISNFTNVAQMTDGRCASTCVTFAQSMKKQGVRSIAFGGRPREAAMSAFGGVRGAQHWTLSLISTYITAARQLLAGWPANDGSILNTEELSRFEQLAPPSIEEMALQVDRHGQSGINFRNAYDEGDDETPLQFAYESADCRMYYTAENVVHPATTWEAAARAMFGGAPCVRGSVNATGPAHHESNRGG